jgi:hypothetical protein
MRELLLKAFINHQKAANITTDGEDNDMESQLLMRLQTATVSLTLLISLLAV